MGQFDWLNVGIFHGYITSNNCNDCPHYAVDIPTTYHTPITALLSGTVLSQRTGLPWGTEIFIKPDNGMPEYYYYHLDTLNTHVGQHLNAGDVIGLSGGQNIGGSNPSSTSMSSGPHTHVGFFTNFKDTPLGSRPFGPDITSLINTLKSGGQVQGNISSGESSVPSPSQSGISFFSNLGQKAGLFVIALIFIIIGFYMLFSKQINGMAGIKNGNTK